MIIDELYHLITESANGTVPRLTRSPFTRSEFNNAYNTNYETPFIVEHDEILMFKDVYLQIFLESYKQQNLHGLILTTNDNHNVINKLSIPSDVGKRGALYRYISCLLTSNMNKINKSSLIWLYYKKLVLLMNPVQDDVIDTILQSSIRHPNNYYCWEFLRFYWHWCHLQMVPLTIDKFQDFCFKHVNDHSAWQFWSYTYKGDDCYYYESCQRLCTELAIPCPLYNNSISSLSVVDEVIQFIETSRVKSWIPYQFLLLFHDQIPINFFDSVDNFETKYGSVIKICNGYYEFANGDFQNLTFVEQLQINGHKKRLQQWIEKKTHNIK